MGGISRFLVCAGWLQDTPVIGNCFVNRIRGSENISFEYDRTWLAKHSGFVLDPELSSDTGRQYPSAGRQTFGFLSDTAPDRWGRKLMDRWERLDAAAENRPVRKLLESDYMLGVHDGGRTGGLRFCEGDERDRTIFLSDREALAAPPVAQLRLLQDAAWNLEQDNTDERKWLQTLVEPGSSLGGARPKANVIDADGSMWIAKFPSRKDDVNVGGWEMVLHDLAALCEIRVPPARLERLSDLGDTFLVRRFDRFLENGKLRRRHFASAMTMLQETDGSENVVSYLDLLGLLEMTGTDVVSEAEELWKRLVFNLCVSNTDDHLKNHGFLLTEEERWQLSPAYDMNPETDRHHLSLHIDFDTDDMDLRLALDTADYYRLSRERAKEIIRRMQDTISRNWTYLAGKYRIAGNEQRRMAPAFAECERIL